MRYRFRIDLRALKRNAPPRERVEISDEPDEIYPLEETGDGRVKAYNASLSWARSQHPGKFVVGGLEYNVFQSTEGTFHVITRPRSEKGERVSEVVVFPDGQLLSRVLAHQDGERRSLENLFREGLELVDVEDEALAELPGYELQATFYHREGDRLAGVTRWQRYFDGQQVVHHEVKG